MWFPYDHCTVMNVYCSVHTAPQATTLQERQLYYYRLSSDFILFHKI